MNKMKTLVSIGVMLTQLMVSSSIDANVIHHKRVMEKKIKLKPGPRGHRGKRGHKGHHGHHGHHGQNGKQGDAGAVGPSPIPTNPIGNGILFTALVDGVPASPYTNPTSYTAGAWNIINPTTTTLNSWAIHYSGDNFTNLGMGQLQYTGTVPIYVKINATLGGCIVPAVVGDPPPPPTTIGFGISLNNVDPGIEQQINATTVDVTSSSAQLNLNGEIIMIMTPGDMIQAAIYTSGPINVGTPPPTIDGLVVDFLEITVSQLTALY